MIEDVMILDKRQTYLYLMTLANWILVIRIKTIGTHTGVQVTEADLVQ